MLLSAPTDSHRSDALDFIRFACAVWVLLTHVIWWAPQVGGGVPEVVAGISGALIRIFQGSLQTHPAVLIFIVLSGYCIHRGGFRGDPRPTLRVYAIRRAFRILPVYFVAIAAGILAWLVSRSVAPEMDAMTGTHHIDAWIVTLRTIGVSAIWPSFNTLTYAGNAPLHTVMVEIWLYAAYPLILLAMLRCGERKVFVAIGFMWVAGALICGPSEAMTNWWHNGSLFGFLPYWWIGATFVGRGTKAKLLAASAVVWVVLAVAAPRYLILIEMEKAALAVMAGSAISALDRNRVPVARVWSWFGKAGYSIYAFHAPVVCLLLISSYPWPVAIAAAIVVGVVVYLMLEKPLTQVGRWLASAQRAESIEAQTLAD